MATVQRWVLEAKEVSAAPSRRSSAPPDDDDDEEAGAPEDASPARSGNYAACMEVRPASFAFHLFSWSCY